MPSVQLKQTGAKPRQATDAATGRGKVAGTTGLRSARSNSQAKPLIISLTSYHKRFASLLRTLNTLDGQSFTGDYSIQVHLSEEDLSLAPQFRAVFDQLQQGSGRIRFFYHPENLRSYKKYYYSLLHHPQAVIVTTDDDVLYPANWLSGLVEKHRQMPGCIVCYRGHYMESRNGRFKKYLRMMFSRRACRESSLWLLPTGVSGVLYPPGALDRAIALDKARFMALAPKADDFWLKLASLANKTPCVRVFTNNTRFPHVPFTQFNALTWHNAALGENDRVLRVITERYPRVFDLLHKPPGRDAGVATEERCV